MCGRFVASSPTDVLADLFEVDEVRVEQDGPRFNVAPTDGVRTVVDRDDIRSLETRRWGLIPHWAASASGAAGQINARAETVHELPAFRDAFARTRCLIAADGFYEWRRVGGVAIPYFLKPAAPVAFAGLRASWGSGEDRLRSCAIVTTAANRRLATLHDRMPVVLAKDAWSGWLDAEERDTAWLRSLLVPAPDDLFEIVPVSRSVNSVRNDGPSLVERVPEAIQDSLPF